MSNHDPDERSLPSRLKHFIVDSLNLPDLRAEDIVDEEPLMGSRIGLDSLDVFELSINLEHEFGIMIPGNDGSRATLTSVASLAEFIRTHRVEDRATQVLLPMEACF